MVPRITVRLAACVQAIGMIFCLLSLTHADDLGNRDVDVNHRRLIDQSHWLQRRGKLTEALTLAESAAKAAGDAYGVESIQVADDLEIIARVQMDLNRYDEAIENTRAVLKIRQRRQADQPWLIRDAENRLTYLNRVNQLTVEQNQKRHDAALAFDKASKQEVARQWDAAIRTAQEGLDWREDVLQYRDAEFFEQLALQGLRYLHQEDGPNAERILAEAMQGMERLQGMLHRQYGSILRAVALSLRDTNAKRAEELLAKAAEIYDQVVGKNHQESKHTWEMLAETRHLLAQNNEQNAQHESAAKHYQQEADAWTHRFDASHWHVREATSNATTQLAIGKLNPQQVMQFLTALETVETISDLVKKREFQTAIDELDEIDQVIRRLIGAANSLSIQMAMTRAEIRQKQLGLDEAWTDSVNIITRQIDFLGSSHPQTRRLVDQLLEGSDQAAGEACEKDNFDLAIEWHDRAIKLLELCDGPDSWRTKNLICKIARLTAISRATPAQRERFSSTFEMLDQAFKLARQTDNDRAIELMNQARQIRTEVIGPKSRDVAYCVNALGSAYEQRGSYAEAKTYYQSGLDLRTKLLGDLHPDVAESRQNLGVLSGKIGDVKQAIDDLRRAADDRLQMFGESDRSYASTLASLGSVHIQQGDGVAAQETLELAVQILRQGNPKPNPELANALHNLGSAYNRNGAGTSAEPIMAEATQMWKTLNIRDKYAISLDNQAVFYEQRGDLESALPLRMEAVKTFQKIYGRLHPTTAIGLANLAALHVRRNEIPAAEKSLRESLDAWLGDFQQAAPLRSEAEMLSSLDRATRAFHRWIALARTQDVKPKVIWEQVVRWKGIVWQREQQLHLASRKPKLQEVASRHTEITRRLSCLMMTPLKSLTAETWRKQFDELQRQRTDLDRQLAGSVPKQQLVTAEEIFRALPNDIPLIDYIITVGFESGNDQSTLGRFKPNLLAFVIRNGIVEIKSLGDPAFVEQKIGEWRKAIDQHASDVQVNRTGLELRKQLWTPLEGLLGPAKVVLISPDGILGQFPFAALPDEQTSKYLIEELAVVTVPVPQALPGLLRRPASDNRFVATRPPSLLLVGDVTYDIANVTGIRHLNHLPGAAKEIDDVSIVYQSVFGKAPDPAVRGIHATEDTFFQRAKGAEVLLLASHGFQATCRVPSIFSEPESTTRGMKSIMTTPVESSFDPFDPFTERRSLPGSQSVIALSGANAAVSENGLDDGLLSAAESAELELDQAELVVLSACGTALGEFTPGEGTLGLQRAFQLAGARTTMATLWSVDDLTTSKLVTRFFNELWNTNSDTPLARIEALRQAQLSVLQPEPSGSKTKPDGKTVNRSAIWQWAAFTMSGDWR